MSRDKTVLWAVDPFETHTMPDAFSIQRLFKWARDLGCEVQPVYVLSSLDRVNGYFAVENFSEISDSVRVAVDKFLSRAGIAASLSVKVILNETSSRKESVGKLLEFAERIKSPWIVVSSHGRAGIGRLVLGSFAENLLRDSKKPVLFLSKNHIGKTDQQFERILFPTDFSDESRSAYDQLLSQAKVMNAEVILFYSNNIPMSAAFVYDVSTPIPLSYLNEQEQEAKTLEAEWLSAATSLGVPARTILKNEGIGPVINQSIHEVANAEHVNLIALTCTSSSMMAFAMGSVSRDVFRQGDYPVLVFGPNAIEKKQFLNIAREKNARENQKPSNLT